jgi:hypothetical protein
MWITIDASKVTVAACSEKPGFKIPKVVDQITGISTNKLLGNINNQQTIVTHLEIWECK